MSGSSTASLTLTAPLRDLASVSYEAMESDVIRIKFKSAMTQTLDRMMVATSAEGTTVTGIREIDSLNH